jgi:hypothetical protein
VLIDRAQSGEFLRFGAGKQSVDCTGSPAGRFLSPTVRLWKFVLDLLFFFGFGFVIPCAEMMAILIN